jgi:hypothetical protein
VGHCGARIIHLHRPPFQRRRIGDVCQPALRDAHTKPVNEDPRRQGSVFASVALARAVSVSVQHTQTRLYQGISRDRSGLLTSVHVSRNAELMASVTYVRDERGRARKPTPA